MADQQFTFLVNGRPRPKQSARFVKGRVRSVVKTNPKLAHWDAAIKEAALSAMAEAKSSDRWQPHTREPLFLIMDFRLPIKDPSRQGYPHTNKPDADNLAKQVMDALENIGCLKGGDQFVARLEVTKTWCAYGDEGVTVTVQPVHDHAREMPYLNTNDGDLGIPLNWLDD